MGAVRVAEGDFTEDPELLDPVGHFVLHVLLREGSRANGRAEVSMPLTGHDDSRAFKDAIGPFLQALFDDQDGLTTRTAWPAG